MDNYRPSIWDYVLAWMIGMVVLIGFALVAFKPIPHFSSDGHGAISTAKASR